MQMKVYAHLTNRNIKPCPISCIKVQIWKNKHTAPTAIIFFKQLDLTVVSPQISLKYVYVRNVFSVNM